MKQDSRLVTVSWQIYGLLIGLYPTSFRQAFGREMALAFRDQCRRKERHGGMIALVQFWLEALIDLFVTVFSEHLQEAVQTPMQMVVKLCGLVGALGGFLLLLVLYIIGWGGGFNSVVGWPFTFWYYPLSYALPLIVGTFGLYLTHSSESGLKLKICLVFALMGTLLMAFDVLLFDGWLGQGVGMALHAVGLLLFGLSIHATHKFLDQRKLLIMIGFLSLTLLLLLPGISGEMEGLVFLSLWFVYGAGWLLLGLMLALAKHPIESHLSLFA